MKDSGGVMEHVEISKTEVQGEFVINGVLTINHAAEIKRNFREMIEDSDNCLVRISEQAEADLSFLQLLCSACKTALKRGKTFAVSGNLTGKCRRLLEEAGYPRKKGCSSDTNHRCIWIVREGRE